MGISCHIIVLSNSPYPLEDELIYTINPPIGAMHTSDSSSLQKISIGSKPCYLKKLTFTPGLFVKLPRSFIIAPLTLSPKVTRLLRCTTGFTGRLRPNRAWLALVL
jgi:hypothetical protein